MNENSSTNSTTSTAHHGLTAEAISRRAYELWEQEGRPENRDLHHWLRAEQELIGEQERKGGQSSGSNSAVAVARHSDAPPTQVPAARATTSGSRNPAKPPSSRASTQPGMRSDTIRSSRS